MEEDGTTYLNVLNPDNTGFINDKERIITLGEKVNKLKAGKHSIIVLNHIYFISFC